MLPLPKPKKETFRRLLISSIRTLLSFTNVSAITLHIYLRDVSKVFQGVTQGIPQTVNDADDLVR